MAETDPKQNSPYPESVIFIRALFKKPGGIAVVGFGAVYGIYGTKVLSQFTTLQGRADALLWLVPLSICLLVSTFSKKRRLADWLGSGWLPPLSASFALIAFGALLREVTIFVVFFAAISAFVGNSKPVPERTDNSGEILPQTLAETSQTDTNEYKKFVFSCLRNLIGIGIMVLGAAYGIMGYKLFDEVFTLKATSSGIMTYAFLGGVPFCIGLINGFLAKEQRLAGWAGNGLLPLFSTALLIFSAGAFLREGTICIVMATPILLLFAVIGAITGGVVSLLGKSKSPKLLSVGLIMPFMFAPIEQRMPPKTLHQHISQSIFIAAKPETLWQHINYPLNIQREEFRDGLAYQIGAPCPIEARTLEGKVGGLRSLRWERGVKFEAVITDWQPNQYIAWTYKFAPGSFPPGSLDDHIVIGGRYFNLESTAYTLQPEGGGTRLTIQVNTSVSTSFNHYADFWARFLIDDAAKSFLHFYKVRAEVG
jgi:hypothetical protein